MYRNLGNSELVMYDLVGTFGFFAIFVYNFFMFRYKRLLLSNVSSFMINTASKNKKLKFFRSESLWAFIEIFIISCLQILPSSFFNVKLSNILETGANYFGLLLFIPTVLVPFFYIISVNPLKQMDLITPAYPLALIFTKLACFCNGCCGGIECSWGLINYSHGSEPIREFPVQLVEAVLALIIFVFFMFYKKKAKEGTLFPLYVILYSATRFFSEFTRNEPNVLGVLKVYHLLCIVGVIVGVAELVLVLKHSEKITQMFDHPVFTWYQKKQKNIVHHKKRKK